MTDPVLRPDSPRHLVPGGRRYARLAWIAVVGLLAWPSGAPAAELSATPATLGSVFAAAQPGDTILLANGSYGTWSGGSKPGMVTLRPAAGANPSIAVNLSSSTSNVTLDGFQNLAGNRINAATNVTISNSRFTQGLDVVGANSGVTLDRDTFDGLGTATWEGRLSFAQGAKGVVVKNSHFGGGGCSDGVFLGDSDGIVVQGNEFAGIVQQGCAEHVDSIQIYGGRTSRIVDNYFHDNTDEIMAPDGGDHNVISNNVMVGAGYEPAVQMGSHNGTVFSHNTVKGINVHMDSKPGEAASRDGVMRDNIMLRSGNQGGAFNTTSGSGCSNCTIDHNLYSTAGSARGTAALVGTPIFMGAASLVSFPSFLLAPGSPGFRAASDGLDIGINATPGAASAPAAAPGPSAARAAGTAPKVALSQPVLGARFVSRLSVAASARDDHGIDRVGFWIDGHWIGTDRKARYAVAWRVSKGTAYRSHTVTARAFAVDGQVSSVAVTVRRVHRHAARGSSASARRSAWRLQTSPSRGGTMIKGRGRARHKVVATLTRCDDPAAKVAARITLRATSKGVVAPARRSAANLCVLSLRPV
jgi:hypothetical protein